MDYENMDYIEVVFETRQDLETAKTVLPFSAVTSANAGLLDPKNWDKETIIELLSPVGLKFTIPEEGFTWDEFGDDGQWENGPEDEGASPSLG